jgi:hypothetical protein
MGVGVRGKKSRQKEAPHYQGKKKAGQATREHLNWIYVHMLFWNGESTREDGEIHPPQSFRF